MTGFSRSVPGVVTAVLLTGVMVLGIQTLSLGQGGKNAKDKDVRVINTAAEARH